MRAEHTNRVLNLFSTKDTDHMDHFMPDAM